MPRPSAGDWLHDEIAGWRAEDIDIVISLLESDEISELGLGREPELCNAQGIEFISLPIPDRGVPSSSDKAASLVRSISAKLSEDKAVAIHCRAGIGRSSLVAACVLVCSGATADAAFEIIEKARGTRVPDTDEQRAWVVRFQERVKSSRE